MAELDGGGPSFFHDLAAAYVGDVQVHLGQLQQTNGFEFRRHAALEELGGSLADGTVAWNGLCGVLRETGAAELKGRRLVLAGQTQMRFVNGRPVDGGGSNDLTAEIASVPLTVGVTVRPDRHSGFAPDAERAATWSPRRARAREALTAAIFDNVGRVEILVTGPLASRSVQLGNFGRRYTLTRPQPPYQLSDPTLFRDRYNWKGDETPDEASVKADVDLALRDIAEQTALMASSVDFFAKVDWKRPRK